MNESQIPVARVILQALADAGAEYLFGVPGGPLLPLYEELAEAGGKGVVPVLAKHEEGAAFMAEGYAQVSGQLGAACGTTGPGAMNALTALASATSDFVPLLFLSGQVARSAVGHGSLQDSSGGTWSTDVVAALRPATKLSMGVADATQLPVLLDHAIAAATVGLPGAAHLNIPADVLAASVPETATRPITRSRGEARGVPDSATLNRLAEALDSSRHPVILAGQGAKRSGAGTEITALAETLQAPVATTLKGKGTMDERHRLALGVFGFGGTAAARDAVFAEDVDLVLVVGSSLGELATFSWDPRLAAGRIFAHIDADPSAIGNNYRVDLPACGDAKATIRELLAILGQDRPEPSVPRQVPSRAVAMADDLQQGHEVLQSSAVVARLSELLPAETILFVDNGNSLSWAGQYFQARHPGQIHFSLNTGSMGYAVAAAIGGKLAAPDRPVVALAGDAAFAMHGMEVHTAAENGVPVIWVVLNNGGHAMVGNVQQMLFARTSQALFRQSLDAAAIAGGLGAATHRVQTLAELDDAVGAALQAAGPCLIDTRVDFNEVPWALGTRAATLRDSFALDVSEHPA